MYCSNCGKHNPDTSRFCQSCGAALRPGATGGGPVMPETPYVGRVPAGRVRPKAKKKPPALKIVGIVLAAALVLAVVLLSGAFSNAPLRVTELSDAPPEDCITSLYRLTAGDKAAQEPYTFACNVGDVQLGEGEILTVGIGLEYITDASGNETLSYIPIEADYKNGVASATFTPADYLDVKDDIRSSGESSLSRRPVKGLCLGIYFTRTYQRPGTEGVPGSFRILARRIDAKLGLVNEDVADGILADLENAYYFYLDRGYSFSQRTKWPMDIKTEWLGSDLYGAYYPMSSVNSSLISLNLSMFIHADMEPGKTYNYTAGENFPLIVHEMGHFMQHCCAGENDCIWTDEACSSYYEWASGGDIRTLMGEHLFRTLGGVYPGEATADNGYARMPLFRYLEEYVRPGFIHDLYAGSVQGYEGASGWNAAITMLCGDPANYASDYYQKLLLGQLGPYSALTVYNMAENPGGDGNVGTVAKLELPSAGTPADSLFPEGTDNITLGSYKVTAYSDGAQYLAIEASSGAVPEGAELCVLGYDECEMCAYRISSNILLLPGSGPMVVLDGFTPANGSKGPFYLVQLVGLHSGKDGAVTAQKYELTVVLRKTGVTPATPDIADSGNAGDIGGDAAHDSGGPGTRDEYDGVGDAVPEMSGVHINSTENIPNARSGSISNAPYMHIDSFSITGGSLTEPGFTPMTNEAFIYSNKGSCSAGETVGLEMTASARDRDNDPIAYNIVQNQLVLTITFYGKDGSVIGGTPAQKSPDGGTEHTISGSISAVVPDNAASVTINGRFSHQYVNYGEAYGSSVEINVDYTVGESMADGSSSGGTSSGGDQSGALDCEQFWDSMDGYWMCCNSAGEAEYFQFARESGGEKALLVGTVETGRAEPSEHISVSKYDGCVYEVVYRYGGADYKLYFDSSGLGNGVIYYAANSPDGYRAFDYAGAASSEAMDYYNRYYGAAG